MDIERHIVDDVLFDKIVMEYNRYVTTKKMLELLYKNCVDDREKYEAKNILERWLLASANLKSSDPVYSPEIIKNPEHEINKKLVSELLEKRLYVTEKYAEAALKEILKFPGNFLENTTPVTKNNLNSIICLSRLDKLIVISYLDFTKEISQIRYETLLKKGNISYIMFAILRYASIISSSQHWSMSLENYQKYVREYKVDIEGFASPFNSQIILIDDNARFCSIFKDTDEIFGSLGDFMEADFQGHSVAINPPYVVSIMNSMVDKCLLECQKAMNNKNKVRFFIIFAAWKDTKAYNLLVTSSFLKHTSELAPGKHYYIDSNIPIPNGQYRKIYAKFATVFFVLSYGFSDKPSDYFQALKPMSLS